MEFLNPNNTIPIESAANCEENDTLVFFERIGNSAVKGKLIDFIYNIEQKSHEEGRRIQRYTDEGKFEIVPPRTRSEVESDFEMRLKEVKSYTDVTLGGHEATTESISIRLCWPTGERFSEKQMSITEAHEKGHKVRVDLIGNDVANRVIGEAFNPGVVQVSEEELEPYKKWNPDITKDRIKEYLFSAHELIERMSQLKNYFGMKGDEEFTKEHLEYARINYIRDTGFNNEMTQFFQAITSEKEEVFIKLMNTIGI
jgi:hypothetical protein